MREKSLLDESDEDDSELQRDHSVLAFNRANLVEEGQKVCMLMAGQILGEGGFASVSLAKCRESNKLRAVKRLQKSKISCVESFRHEVAIMSSLDHPHIIRIYSFFEDEHHMYLVMELCQGKELYDKLAEYMQTTGCFSEQQCANILQQMLSAVCYLHSHGVVHRDLKPENFLFKDMSSEASLKLIDFGFAKKMTESKPLTTKRGTPMYVAPEVLSGSYDEKCDIWSIGVITHIALSGWMPFESPGPSPDHRAILKQVKKGIINFPFERWSHVSPQALSLLKSMVSFNPKDRPSAEKLLENTWLWAKHPKPDVKINSNEILENFQRFTGYCKFQKIALTSIAFSLCDDEIKNLKNVFKELDTNGDGTLSLKEVERGLGQANVDTKRLESMVRHVDSNNSGRIDYTEFIAACMHRKQVLREDVCMQAFRQFDRNGDGEISAQELQHLLGTTRLSVVRDMINNCDRNGDGKICFDEFVEMLHKN